MPQLKLYCQPGSESLLYAEKFLIAEGIIPTETPDNITHYLAPIPTRSVPKLPDGATLIGGNLTIPGIDLLMDPFFLAENAAITAECAIQLAMDHLPITLTGTETLILGWGRIAKCLAKKLNGISSAVSISARKESDLAMASALGSNAFPLAELPSHVGRYRVIFNTVPAMILPEEDARNCRPDALLMDLASQPGIGGSNVILARGLPGKMAPESAGRLIAKAVIRHCLKKEVSL